LSDAISILLIDGNHQERDYYAQRLRLSSADYNIVQAVSGQSGLDMCSRQSIDCVVLEFDLPDMSGFEVLAKLVPIARRPEIAVVIHTGLPNSYLLDLALKNGAQAALHKTSGDVLEQTVLKAIATVKWDRKRRNEQLMRLSDLP
jgi:PleD family two-component response regulator